MQTVRESTTAHVRRVVRHHEFIDPADWASALDELAAFTDAEIDALARHELGGPRTAMAVPLPAARSG